jgi:hypothetical protein
MAGFVRPVFGKSYAVVFWKLLWHLFAMIFPVVISAEPSPFSNRRLGFEILAGADSKKVWGVGA